MADKKTSGFLATTAFGVGVLAGSTVGDLKADPIPDHKQGVIPAAAVESILPTSEGTPTKMLLKWSKDGDTVQYRYWFNK